MLKIKRQACFCKVSICVLAGRGIRLRQSEYTYFSACMPTATACKTQLCVCVCVQTCGEQRVLKLQGEEIEQKNTGLM